MLAFLVFIAVLVLVFGLLVVIKIRIDIRIVLVVDGKQSLLDMEIIPLGRMKWKKQHRLQVAAGHLVSALLDILPPKRQRNKSPGWFTNLSTAQQIISLQRLLPIIKSLLSVIHIKDIYWKSICGGEDAMQTALTTGTLWAFKGIFISTVSSCCRLEHMRIEIDSDFEQERLWSRFSGIFQMRLVHIILVGAYITVWMVRGYLNGRTAARKSAQSSHRGINENCYAKY